MTRSLSVSYAIHTLLLGLKRWLKSSLTFSSTVSTLVRGNVPIIYLSILSYLAIVKHVVPIATRYPPRRAQFEVHDVNEAFRWSESTFDVVHARCISMAVICFLAGLVCDSSEYPIQTTNYPVILKEVARTLRTGGLFLSIERGRYPAFYPPLHIEAALFPTLIPHTCRFFGVVNQVLELRGISNIAPSLPSILNGSGLFTNVTTEYIFVPIGKWPSNADAKKIGRAFRASLVRYADSVKPMLKQEGIGEADIEALVQGYVHDLRNVRGMVGVFHAVYARKL